jgi:hypothetical protein
MYIVAGTYSCSVSDGAAWARWVDNRNVRPAPYCTATSMRYVGPLPMQSGHAGLYVQTIRLAKGASGGASLELAYQPYSDDTPPTGEPVRHLLLADLRGGRFQYLAAAAFGKPAAWRDDWQAANGLPLAVRIQLDPAWRARVPFPEMVIPVHAGEGFGAQPGGAP